MGMFVHQTFVAKCSMLSDGSLVGSSHSLSVANPALNSIFPLHFFLSLSIYLSV